jgi:hypothetical protein
MSRTDKDAPWWVQAEYWEPLHAVSCEFYIGYFRREYRACNLPPAPIRQDQSHPRSYIRTAPCSWVAVMPHKDRYRYTRPPTREDKHLGWWGPDRRKVRDLMVSAKQLYRGGSDPDIITPRHHRHASNCGWWD